MKQKAYLVDWRDSATQYGWLTTQELDSSETVCQTIGFYVDESKIVLTLALNRGLKGTARPYGDLIHIPKSAILKKRRIKI